MARAKATSGYADGVVVGSPDVGRLDLMKEEIEVNAGRIGIDFSNRDFFWHTFTISKLHVNLTVATRGESRTNFTATPGTYEFTCLIHAQAGMKGTLVVR